MAPHGLSVAKNCFYDIHRFGNYHIIMDTYTYAPACSGTALEGLEIPCPVSGTAQPCR